MITRINAHSMQITNGPGQSALRLTRTWLESRVSIQITGPRGGRSRQTLIVNADELLNALQELNVISKGSCKNCSKEIADGDILCNCSTDPPDCQNCNTYIECLRSSKLEALARELAEIVEEN